MFAIACFLPEQLIYSRRLTYSNNHGESCLKGMLYFIKEALRTSTPGFRHQAKRQCGHYLRMLFQSAFTSQFQRFEPVPYFGTSWKIAAPILRASFLPISYRPATPPQFPRTPALHRPIYPTGKHRANPHSLIGIHIPNSSSITPQTP